MNGRRTISLLPAMLLALPLVLAGQGKPAKKTAANVANPVVALETTMGTIKVQLFTGNAPITTKNFLGYVNAGFYNGTIIHRIDFVVGGGGYTEMFAGKQDGPPIKNESRNGLKNLRGTVAMARFNDPNSATSQFFINLKDNPHLDPPKGGWGYAVFAKVVEGMDVVDKIAKVKTGKKGPFYNIPMQNIVVKTAKVLP